MCFLKRKMKESRELEEEGVEFVDEDGRRKEIEWED